MKTSSRNIRLSELFEDQIISRSSVLSLLSVVFDAQQVSIDFTGISFISRAAAHELLLAINEFSRKGVNIELINLTGECKKMMDIVSISIKNPVKKPIFLHSLNLKSSYDIQNYLLSI